MGRSKGLGRSKMPRADSVSPAGLRGIRVGSLGTGWGCGEGVLAGWLKAWIWEVPATWPIHPAYPPCHFAE